MISAQEKAAEEELFSSDLPTYISTLTHSWSKTLATLGFTLIPIFFILDVFMMPSELLPRFAVYRGLTTLLIIMQFLVIRRTRASKLSFLHGYFFTAVAGFMIALMTTDLGGWDSTYYAGLNLVMIAVNLLLPWEAYHSAINGLFIVLMYVGCNLVVKSDVVTSGIIVNNLYFLTSTVVITTSINYVKQRLVKQEFFLRSDLRRARDALWGEMEVAKHIQTALLPKIQQIPGYELAAVMVPAEEVGGDYYDVIQTRAGETWICIGDVSGHGVESGLIMMMTQTSIFTAVNDRPGQKPSGVLDTVNAVIRQNVHRLEADRYMTLTVTRLEPGGVVYAGRHQDMFVHRRATGKVDTLPTSGTWIGIVDELGGHSEDARATIDIGDTVLLFTDGVTEAMNSAGEMFGENRLMQALERYAGQGTDQIVSLMMRDVQQFMDRQSDDLTLLVLRRSA